MLEYRDLTNRFIGLAIEVRRNIGPGLLEAVYKDFLSAELEDAGIAHRCKVAIPVFYKGGSRPLGFRADLVVDSKVIVEVKATAAPNPAFEPRLLTYLHMSHIRVGLPDELPCPRLRDGLRCFIV